MPSLAIYVNAGYHPSLLSDGGSLVDKLLEYGLAGVVVACVMTVIVAPVIKAIIAHSRESLKLLERAVDQNTKAIESFQRFEERQTMTNELISDSQKEILEILVELRTGAATSHASRARA